MTPSYGSLAPSDSTELTRTAPDKSHDPEPTACSDADSAKADRAGFWRVFASTFATIFLAELGDKTQIATLLISAESGRPFVVFLGAGTALIATSLIGVALGRWISRRMSAKALDTAAGALLLVITVWLLLDVITF